MVGSVLCYGSLFVTLDTMPPTISSVHGSPLQVCVNKAAVGTGEATGMRVM
jgi:hypothetical protein